MDEDVSPLRCGKDLNGNATRTHWRHGGGGASFSRDDTHTAVDGDLSRGSVKDRVGNARMTAWWRWTVGSQINGDASTI
ncbi:hypothetical protein E2542_SST25919 [Spatholobus suberectus]|nr:hypothetical protein E2542_SST25919 [Spatholobus suberectus]